VVELVGKALKDQGKKLSNAKVLVLGATFKENVTDLRNSKAAEMSQLLAAQAGTLDIIDPHADPNEMRAYYGLELAEVMSNDYDVVIYAVNHKELDSISWEFLKTIKSTTCVVFDFKKLLGYPTGNEAIKYMTL